MTHLDVVILAKAEIHKTISQWIPVVAAKTTRKKQGQSLIIQNQAAILYASLNAHHFVKRQQLTQERLHLA